MKKYLFLFLSFVALTVQAQQPLSLSVEEFADDPFDLSAKNETYRKDDGSGTLFAIVKVTSTDPKDDLKAYQFNFGLLKHEVELKDDVLWVYVQRNAKTVTITRPGYRSVARYDLGLTIEAGKNYVMTLSPQAKAVQKQLVMFNVEPAEAGAVIMTKREDSNAPEELFGVTDAEGIVAKNMEFGKYTYTVTSDYYKRTSGMFTLNKRNVTHTERVKLTPDFTAVTLYVENDADIYIDAQKKGSSTWSGRLKKGRYQLECRLDGHRSSSQVLEVNDEPTIDLTLKSPEPIWGTLVVLSKPLGVDVCVDGKDYGKTPLSKDFLIGNHEIKLSREKYADSTQVVVLKEGESTELLVDMRKLTRSERASVKVQEELKADADKPEKTDKKTVPNPEKYKFLKRTSLYADAGVNLGIPMGWNIAVGTYLKGFNMEAYYMGCFGKIKSVENKYYSLPDMSSDIFAFKLGWGFVAKPRFRITPQVGANIMRFQNSDFGSYKIGFVMGVRMEIPFTKHFGVSITPEGAVWILEGKEGYNLPHYYPDLANREWFVYGGKIGIYCNF